MFGGSSNSSGAKSDTPAATDPISKSDIPSEDSKTSSSPDGAPKLPNQAASGEKRSGNGSPSGRQNSDNSAAEKKRRSSGVGSKASNFIASAKNTLNFQSSRSNSDSSARTPLQKLGKQDQALAVPQGQHNNSAGESLPGPRSTFRVGVWEDRNKKCRRTMEDTHAFLYNFLPTPAPLLTGDATDKISKRPSSSEDNDTESASQDMIETDNGYFAIFDGHAGTFAADWCGKKLHLVLEDIIRRNPNAPIPELLDQTFTSVDTQLEKLPLKNSGCTAAIAVLRWEDRVPSSSSATGSQAIAPAAAVASKTSDTSKPKDSKSEDNGKTITIPESTHARLKGTATRQRVLYTANVGDARIILCRAGKALRLSYDHKGSDENEGKRIANAGGLILNNRVNGVLAVTRALGDSYMKDLVTGHPYTTETVIQPELDEFIIIACDGLWDVCSDQEAVDLIRDKPDPVAASKLLVDHALARFSTDNLSCMIIRFDKAALLDQNNKDRHIGVEGDSTGESGKVSEADKIVSSTKQKIAEGDTPAVGISASNSGRGRDPTPIDDGGETFKPTIIKESVEEEPSSIEEEGGDTPPAAKDNDTADVDGTKTVSAERIL
ncbi:phosphatase 2C-like domain-containing protein [Xylaria bambusicola]|uniref:phosphatase 2C-like domain-containing protein n=1 Tax=Xylaria bambusicola TaxID=326684 RepID=UPI00200785CE|nr:phosphatase 2C-like domain-containing protein [Xylaria bambusicola]KAI0527738.1 phosphatase 2C-like domain-containing protein [Xylaria bambusicola]